jgi:signal transduction histidine kinase
MKRAQRSNPASSDARTRSTARTWWRADTSRARVLRFVAGFVVFALAVGFVSGIESRWELWTTGLLGLLACIAYPELHSRGRPHHRRGVSRPRDACEPRHAHLRRNPMRARQFPTGLSRARTLAAAGEAQHERVADVSHELRAPLTVLLGFVETVKDLDLELAPETRRDYLDRMETQCRRMHGIIEDMLRPSPRRAAVETAVDGRAERVNVAGMLERVRAEAEALSAGRHAISVEGDGRYDLMGSEREIASVFGNLASNAVRYTPAGGRVRLVWRASLTGASLTVEDSGIGIAREHLPRLTERFYCVDRSRGTGLGLAIVKQALLRHQGALEIESEPGRGSRFTARFPAHRVVAAATSPQRAIA